jgi:hypothetical protein
MKTYLTLVLLLISTFTAKSQTILSADALQKDFEIMRKSYETLHPGLYKYAAKSVIDGYFEECKKALNHDQSLQEAYLNFHKLTSKFKCGHAYPNFFNQEAFLKKELFENKNCLPFHFKWIDGRMLVVKSADSTLKEGLEIKSINGNSVAKIIKTLLPIVRADGSNDGKRLKLLEITGQYFEYFDIFFPMCFPNKISDFEIVTFDLDTKKTDKIMVKSVNHTEREKILKAKFQEVKLAKANFKWMDSETAIMEINTFENYKYQYDFNKFFRESFTEFKQKNGKNLIIDVRKNEGGNTSDVMKLIKFLTPKPIEFKDIQNTWAFLKIDSTLENYVDNKDWAKYWFNKKAENFTLLPSGQYKDKNLDKIINIEPEKELVPANIYLLTSPTNSSATYILVDIFKTHHLATIVGQTTGGNQKGITASAMFFMLLPNTKIEVDVPLIGTDYAVAQTRPDAGISPDVYVKPNITDIKNDIDTEMEVVKKLISEKK